MHYNRTTGSSWGENCGDPGVKIWRSQNVCVDLLLLLCGTTSLQRFIVGESWVIDNLVETCWESLEGWKYVDDLTFTIALQTVANCS